MNVTDEEFWRLSPHQYFALIDQHEKRTRDSFIPAAIISSTIVNMTPGRKGPAAKIEDFLPELETSTHEVMRAEDMKALFDNVIIPEQKRAAQRRARKKRGKR